MPADGRASPECGAWSQFGARLGLTICRLNHRPGTRSEGGIHAHGLAADPAPHGCEPPKGHSRLIATMTLWLVLTLMTAAAILVVLWPLSRNRVAHASGSDLAVYKDQIGEIARDRAAGLIGEAEAAAARVEISRRLL